MSPSQLVLLNELGKQFTTTAATLTVPEANGSMLARLVELHLGQQMSQPSAGAMQPALTDNRLGDALFIDRDGSLFHYILNYLR